MKKLLCLLLALVCLCPAVLADEVPTAMVPVDEDEDQAVYFGEPVSWDEDWPYAPHPECYLPDNAGYHDASLDVRIETYRRDDTNVMAMFVTIQDPHQIRTALAGAGKSTAPVAAMAKKSKAVAACNGDYFNYHPQGIVIRNLREIRMKPNVGRDTLIIDENGDFHIISDTTQELFDAYEGQAVQAFCFGPGLVIDGEPLTDLDTVTLDCGKLKKTQRIAIGQTGPLSYVIVTCEGPENKGSVGFDLLQMTQFCYELGVINCYNLDGGSSSTIVLNNAKINAVSSKKIRSVGDAICFMTLVP